MMSEKLRYFDYGAELRNDLNASLSAALPGMALAVERFRLTCEHFRDAVGRAAEALSILSLNLAEMHDADPRRQRRRARRAWGKTATDPRKLAAVPK